VRATEPTLNEVEFFYFWDDLVNTVPRPKFPPNNWNILITAALLYDKSLPDVAKVTWAQLRGMTLGGSETPPFSASEFEEATGTKEKTLYGHLRVLRDRHALSWRRGSGSTFIVAFECQLPEPDIPPEILEIENSGNPDNPFILDQAKNPDHQAKEVAVSENPEFSKSRKPAAPKAKPPPKVDAIFEAVARATKRTPPDQDWSKLPDVTRGILNKVCGQLRKVKATADQIDRFPAWFETLKATDYRYKRGLEPWDLPKLWTQYLGDQNAGLRQHAGAPDSGAATGTGTSRVAARVAAIQRAADQRVRSEVPALRPDAGTVPD